MKSRKILLISVLLVLSLIVMACSLPVIKVVKGSGTLATESREISDLTAVHLDGAVKMVITQGESTSLTVGAEDNLISSLQSTVDGDTPKLYYQDNIWQKTLLPTETIL